MCTASWMERVFEAMMKAYVESRAWILFWYEIALNEQVQPSTSLKNSEATSKRIMWS